MLYIVFYICFYFLLSSCATVVSPSGGEKDIFPPKILSSYPKNESVNFNENQIIINFDEYIQIKNRSEINFFPEINPRPTIKTKGRSIVINLSSGLRPNTTHIINFNKSIVDLNESNPLNDFEYVFSTGSFIDTCSLSGSIFNLKSNIKTTDAVVGLFKNGLAINYDSLVRKTSANYFVYSDENGNYNFSNLKQGDYLLCAFQDLNLSNKYEQPEPVSMPVEINLDKNQIIHIPLFIEDEFLEKNPLSCLYKQKKEDSLNTGGVNLNFEKEIYEENKYVGELILGDSTVFCFNINSKITPIDSLLVGIYSFRMFEDLNTNQIWDSGNIKKLINPEKIIFFQEQIEIKKDWEIDVFIN